MKDNDKRITKHKISGLFLDMIHQLKVCSFSFIVVQLQLFCVFPHTPPSHSQSSPLSVPVSPLFVFLSSNLFKPRDCETLFIDS